LQRLEAMQSLDAFTDTEGCAAIYDRLLKLLGGDDAAVNERLATTIPYPCTYDDFRVVRRWINEVDSGTMCWSQAQDVSSKLLLKMYELVSITMARTSSDEELCGWIDKLNVEDCISLLQLWLLAMGAKDASLIVTLRSPSPHAANCHWSHEAFLIDLGPKPLSKMKKKFADEDSLCKAVSALGKDYD
jgi:Inositol-pentakisphosphate 2-kinase